MKISIDGTGPRNADKLEAATRFFAAQLLHVRTVDKIELDIEIVNSLDVEGECISEDDTKNPRYFTVRLRKQPLNEMIRTLAHEMVHVKQYAKNELGKELALARGGKGLRIVTRWMGEFWTPKGKEDAYWDAPWEIEAYGREVGLHHKWVAFLSK
jgi:hypothetical protein